MTAPDVVAKLVEKFESHKEAYRSPQYNEAQVRQEFVNPLFAALGWDVYNTKGYSEAHKEVIHEDAIKVGGRTKAPDYCFRIGGGVRTFFVEAKKPAVDIRDAVSPAYQLRRYAWSAKLPLSILTDFEEFAIYDCRVRPAKTDKASAARVKYLRYTEYVERWGELYDLLSPEAIRKGSLDKFISSKKAKRGTAEVDVAFLEEIESWRNELARNLALRNSELSQRELNFAVQRTIDRIIFLRICEDRGIEQYGSLQKLLGGPRVYARLGELFHRADERYNSGLFHFTAEKNRPEPPDEMTLSLSIDDKTLKEILTDLYYPESPYEFSVLPAEILGQVYEQFLGKVIRLTRGHQARVEEKPEVKKAGGVYYTPSYIVDYIVEHTVGKLVEGKKPKQVERLKIVDPACGSGSFLIVAYQFLLDWHRDWYENDDPEKHARGRAPKLYRSRTGQWRLTTAEKKRILLNNIHGVDIDSQAVEVTKLSLLLKVLEGESQETLQNQLRLFHERALPDLSANIKCGNSLIGPDYFGKRQHNFLDEDEIYRVNAFDWKDEFPGVFNRKNPGFDAVIGNPPYIRIQLMKETQPEAVDYCRTHYEAAPVGNYDIYVLFIEKALSLLNTLGVAGYICPHKFLNAKYGLHLRTLLSKGKHVEEIVHFDAEQIFSGATTYTCLIFLTQGPNDTLRFVKVKNLERWQLGEIEATEKGSLSCKALAPEPWILATNSASALLKKISHLHPRLKKRASRIFQGLKTGADSVFILECREGRHYYSKCLDRTVDLESRYLRPLYKSGNFKRYALNQPTRVIIFPYAKSHLEEWSMIEEKAPLTAEYLLACKTTLEKREQGRWKGSHWYCYSRQQALEVITEPKILTADLNPRASFCVDDDGVAAFTGGAAGGYGILVPHKKRLLVLGLLNSRLLDWYLKQISSVFRGGWYSFESRFIENLPVCDSLLDPKEDKARHDHMVSLVKSMLTLHEKLPKTKSAHRRTVLQRQITATDRQIDQLVYELYGLNEKEIALVEEATARHGKDE